MLETKVETVAPSGEQRKIEEKACFGWRLKSSQEINSKESHLEKDGLYGIKSVTTKENYVKLVFERDKNMANYDKITALECKYYNNIANRPELSKMILAIPPIVGLLACAGLGSLGEMIPVVGFVISLIGEILFIAGLVVDVIYWWKTRKAKKAWSVMIQSENPKLLSQARSLLR